MNILFDIEALANLNGMHIARNGVPQIIRGIHSVFGLSNNIAEHLYGFEPVRP